MIAVVIREITSPDIKTIANIAAEIMPHAWSETTFLDCLKPEYHNVLIEADEQIIGFLVIKIQFGESELMSIGVAKEFQKQGYAKQLMQYLFNYCAGKNISNILLEVRASNSSAINFYMKNGFKKIDVRTGYYPAGQGREDALIFQRGC